MTRVSCFFFDEIQFLSPRQLEALIAALHKTVQRALPVTLVGAGLPQIPRLAGEAKSYAERLFKFPRIGSLERRQAEEALVGPARALGTDFTRAAVDCDRRLHGGLPLLPAGVREDGLGRGRVVAGNRRLGAKPSAPLSKRSSTTASSEVRAERTTQFEIRYLRAMAELGAQPQKASDVARSLGRTSDQLGPTRSRLIDKGLLYTPGYGLAAFTVPQFDRYLLRAYPTEDS